MSALNRSLRRLLASRALRVALLAILAGWTLFWGVEAVQGILRDSILGRSGIQGIPAFHQVWEVVFVSAYYFLRWAALAAPVGLVLAAPALARQWSRIRSPREALSES